MLHFSNNPTPSCLPLLREIKVFLECANDFWPPGIVGHERRFTHGYIIKFKGKPFIKENNEKNEIWAKNYMGEVRMRLCEGLDWIEPGRVKNGNVV